MEDDAAKSGAPPVPSDAQTAPVSGSDRLRAHRDRLVALLMAWEAEQAMAARARLYRLEHKFRAIIRKIR
jgi:hypothetical protein